MDLRYSSITADILNILLDGQKHTALSIANELGINKKTVYRHVSSLSFRFPIDIIAGGRDSGGIYLDKKYIQNGKILTRDELQIINEALSAWLQTNESDETKRDLIIELLKIYNLPPKKEIENGNDKTECCC